MAAVVAAAVAVAVVVAAAVVVADPEGRFHTVALRINRDDGDGRTPRPVPSLNRYLHRTGGLRTEVARHIHSLLTPFRILRVNRTDHLYGLHEQTQRIAYTRPDTPITFRRPGHAPGLPRSHYPHAASH